MRDFPYLRLGIRDFKTKWRRDSRLKVCAGGGMPKVLGRDYEIEKRYWGPFSVIMSSIFTEETC